jgi:nucleoside-diphosphate-sugar epimerase
MNVFVTGGTGFIGSRIVPRLVERGYRVICLVRDPTKATQLRALGVTLAAGDVTDRESMRQPMQGADIVLHNAAWYQIGIRDKERMWRINLNGTENTLGLAAELGVPRIAYVSTLAVFGDTRGQIVDEGYARQAAPVSEYEDSKAAAHEVAERLIGEGAPIIIAMPGTVFGIGDHSLWGTMSRLYLRRRLSILFGPDAGYTHTHVDDTAEAIILAAERGRISESYITAGEPLRNAQVFKLWQRLTGIPAPYAYLPLGLVRPLAGTVEACAALLGRDSPINRESVASSAATMWGSSLKAQRELGARFRSAEDGWRDVLEGERRRMTR